MNSKPKIGPQACQGLTLYQSEFLGANNRIYFGWYKQNGDLLKLHKVLERDKEPDLKSPGWEF